MCHLPHRNHLRRLLVAVLGAVLVWHAVSPWIAGWHARHGYDFASFYFAVQAVWEGIDPWVHDHLRALSRAGDGPRGVAPFFYPPPFLVAFSWTVPFSYETASRLWTVAERGFLVLALLALWRWSPRAWTLPVLFVLALTLSPGRENFRQAQVNCLVMALTLWGLLLAERRHPGWGGALVGMACMFKMSPGLLVAWWALHRRWRAVGVACGVALASTLLALPLVEWDWQLRFYRSVLPAFGSGDYHALEVPIALQANHGVPGLLHDLFPSKTRYALSARALWGSAAVGGTLVLLAALRLRHRPADPGQALCHVGTVVGLMLLLPVYTFDHHLVWALVPATAALLALADGRLPTPWRVPLLLAWAALAVPDAWLDTVRYTLGLGGEPLYYLLRELRFLGLAGLVLACAWAARNPLRDGVQRAHGHFARPPGPPGRPGARRV